MSHSSARYRLLPAEPTRVAPTPSLSTSWADPTAQALNVAVAMSRPSAETRRAPTTETRLVGSGAPHLPLPWTRSKTPTVTVWPWLSTNSQVTGPETAACWTFIHSHVGRPSV